MRVFAFASRRNIRQSLDMDRINDEEMKCYSAPEVAELIGVSEKHVRNLVKEGQLKSLRIGSRVLIRAKDLSDFLDAAEVVA